MNDPVPPRPLRVMIVDDEALARERVRAFLAAEPGVEVAAECADGEAAVHVLGAGGVDVVLLDVQMRGLDGFDVVERVGAARMPVVVFVTAHDAYALRAFDAGAVDYLLKPFDRERLARAVGRARARVAAGDSAAERARLDAAVAAARAGAPGVGAPGAGAAGADRLVVPDRGRLHLVPVGEVDWIEADGNYARVHAGRRSYLMRETMGSLAERLDPARFVRVHRSAIVHAARVREVEPLVNGDCRLVLRDGTTVLASRSYRLQLRAALGLPE